MYYVYIMTNWNNKVLYTGITNDLKRRVYEHKNKLLKGFTYKYNINNGMATLFWTFFIRTDFQILALN